jgi:hypothetical protein
MTNPILELLASIDEQIAERESACEFDQERYKEEYERRCRDRRWQFASEVGDLRRQRESIIKTLAESAALQASLTQFIPVVIEKPEQ